MKWRRTTRQRILLNTKEEEEEGKKLDAAPGIKTKEIVSKWYETSNAEHEKCKIKETTTLK